MEKREVNIEGKKKVKPLKKRKQKPVKKLTIRGKKEKVEIFHGKNITVDKMINGKWYKIFESSGEIELPNGPINDISSYEL